MATTTIRTINRDGSHQDEQMTPYERIGKFRKLRNAWDCLELQREVSYSGIEWGLRVIEIDGGYQVAVCRRTGDFSGCAPLRMPGFAGYIIPGRFVKSLGASGRYDSDVYRLIDSGELVVAKSSNLDGRENPMISLPATKEYRDSQPVVG